MPPGIDIVDALIDFGKSPIELSFQFFTNSIIDHAQLMPDALAHFLRKY